MSTYKDNFIQQILDNSESNEWYKAVLEWNIVSGDEDEEAKSSCICGKENIRYLYKIKNDENGNILFPIGSKCIEKFGRDDLNEIISVKEGLFNLLRRIKSNEFITLKDSGFTRKLIRFFYDQNVFQPNQYNDNNPENDYDFLIKMFNMKKPPSDKQASKIRALIVSEIKPFLLKYLAKSQIMD